MSSRDERLRKAASERSSAIDKRTLVRQAYDVVRRMVTDGTLQPGSKVTVRVIAEDLHLSATPIKTALAALEQGGYLVSEPHRGYFVSTISVEDMNDIYELREVLDGIASRRLAMRSDRHEDVSYLRLLLDKQREHAELGDSSTYSDADVEFHRCLWRCSGNSRLERVTDNLVGLFRFGSGSSSQSPGRMMCAVDEHSAILDAVESGDGAKAENLAREHVRRSAQAFLASIEGPHSKPQVGSTDEMEST